MGADFSVPSVVESSDIFSTLWVKGGLCLDIRGLIPCLIFLSYVINCVTVLCSNTAGQWNQVFVQPPPEEEVHIGVDQDPRVRHTNHHSLFPLLV